MSNPNESGVPEYVGRCRDMAHHYLELGWSVIPLRPDTKVPAIEWALYQERPPTAEEVDAWFRDGVPDGAGGLVKFFGLGLVTGAVSGVVALDCDTQEALAYAVTEADLFTVLGVRTTRGCHLYFKHPGGKVRNRVGGQGRDWPEVAGLDLRGDGGLVVLPPTIKFGPGGEFLHQYSWTVPDAELLDAVFGLSVWPGISRSRPTTGAPPSTDGEWSFDALRLDSVRTYGGSVWERAAERIEKLRRKMIDGDGRNTWMTRYVGECVASGMAEAHARVAAEQFSAEFFDQPLPPAEGETILQSVLGIDRRNHPEKYGPAAPGCVSQTPERAERPSALRLITPSSLAELKKLSAGQQYLIDPYIAPQSIVQVVGFNGHGKSLWLMNMLYAAASGSGLGSGTVEAPVRTLYLDFESSSSTLSARLEDCESLLGPMPEALTMWSKSVSPLQMPLGDGEGLAALAGVINELAPQVVVIDTVREAWLGMEENSPHAWVRVNHAALAIRNAGMSVVLVHHRNKPGQTGHGREAGSAAQLKDLDTQVFITKVVEDEAQARREAAISDCNTQVLDFAGKVRTAFAYLRASLPPGHALKTVFELTFGKLRAMTDNHVPAYFGFAQHITTGASAVVSTKTPRQKAELLAARGTDESGIAELLLAPLPVVRRWIGGRSK